MKTIDEIYNGYRIDLAALAGVAAELEKNGCNVDILDDYDGNAFDPSDIDGLTITNIRTTISGGLTFHEPSEALDYIRSHHLGSSDWVQVWVSWEHKDGDFSK